MECFKWAVIAAMKWEEVGNNPERVSKLRRYEGDFDWSDIEFPVTFRDINKFERNNEIGINILAIENKKIYICRKVRDYNRIVNLMLIADVENPNKNITLPLNRYRGCFRNKTVSIRKHNTFITIV